VEEPPWRLKTPGEYDSIPAGADAIGFNQSHPAFWYVNSYPATAIEIGLTTLGPAFFGSKIDLAVSGVDVGCKYCADYETTGRPCANAIP